MGESVRRRTLTDALTPPQLHAVRYVVARVRAEVHADLVQVSLFGSRARGDARADSDVDLLLVFRSLPPDREPYASHAEQIAEEEAHRLRIPVTVWCVSLVDLALGQRTPMLVDALADSIHVWVREAPLPAVPFTSLDAYHCVSALLHRIEEGSQRVRRRLARARFAAAARRLRDDLVRVCTAHLLLSGVTRPRRSEAVRAVLGMDGSAEDSALVEWVERSYGCNGTEDGIPVPPPPRGYAAAAARIESLRREVLQRHAGLRARLDAP